MDLKISVLANARPILVHVATRAHTGITLALLRRRPRPLHPFRLTFFLRSFRWLNFSLRRDPVGKRGRRLSQPRACSLLGGLLLRKGSISAFPCNFWWGGRFHRICNTAKNGLLHYNFFSGGRN